MLSRTGFLKVFASAALARSPIVAQEGFPGPSHPDDHQDVRLPDGRLQRDEIVKADHARNLEDARQLARLAEEVKADLEKHGQYVLSTTTLKKTEEIEKIARRIRARMKRS